MLDMRDPNPTTVPGSTINLNSRSPIIFLFLGFLGPLESGIIFTVVKIFLFFLVITVLRYRNNFSLFWGTARIIQILPDSSGPKNQLMKIH